jgi:hypothetical protein
VKRSGEGIGGPQTTACPLYAGTLLVVSLLFPQFLHPISLNPSPVPKSTSRENALRHIPNWLECPSFGHNEIPHLSKAGIPISLVSESTRCIYLTKKLKYSGKRVAMTAEKLAKKRTMSLK